MATVNWSLQHKRDTAANWTANNPILLAGQLGIETDNLTTTPKFKIGDGITDWNTLPYATSSASNLSSVLTTGNTTSGNNIVMSGTDVITDSTGTNMFIDLNASTIYSTDGFNRMAFTADISGKTSEISVRDYSVLTLEKGYFQAGLTDIYSGVTSQSTGWYNQIHTNLSHIEVQSNWANFRGIEYLNDWSANYSLRSLVDKGYVINNFVPYTGATSDVDLGTYLLSTKSIRVTGTAGSGDIHLRHQSTDATATGQSTSLFADSNGDLKWKNDGNYYTTLKTSSNTADRIYTYPDANGTIALTSNIGTWGALNYPTWVSGTPFVKMTAAGTFALDTNTYQPLDADLTSWAGVTRASGFDTFTATPSSANLRTLLTDENGTGAALFDGATSPTFTTDITTPLIIGGSAVGSNITYKSTSGTGTTTAAAHTFTGGTNGGTTIATLYNNGNVNIGNYASPNNLRVLTIGQDTAYMSFGSLVGATGNAVIYMNQASPSISNYTLRTDLNNSFLNSPASSGSIFLSNGATTICQMSGASTSGAVTSIAFTVPTHTGQTATEIPNFKVTGNTKTFANGGGAATIATQRWNYFTANTAATSGGGSLTITNSYSLYVEKSVASGVTISKNYSIGTDGGINTAFGAGNGYYINTNLLAEQNGTGTQNSSGLTFGNGFSQIVFNPSVTSSSGFPSAFIFSAPSNTGQTASTEANGYLYNSYTRTWATGNITTQREQYIKTVTYAFAGASTISNAYGLYVEAPTSGTNATITNNWGIGFTGGLFKNSIGNTVLSNAALATNATNGFVYIPTSAGAPTGVPTAYTGTVAMQYDTTNNKLYIYNGGWKSVTLV